MWEGGEGMLSCIRGRGGGGGVGRGGWGEEGGGGGGEREGEEGGELWRTLR